MNSKGMLYVVSTPIGNLKDITLRALEILRAIDYVVCEDTRVTIKLLNTYEIKKPLIALHSKSSVFLIKKVVGYLEKGKDIALVTDSGTPVVSDPGGVVIAEAIARGVNIVPIPGPSAVHAALVASGVSFSGYEFYGFISRKTSRRKKKFEELKERKSVFVFYESPYRVVDFLNGGLEIFGNIRCIVAKEMTKKFERFYRGNIKDVIDRILSDGVKGEYTVIFDNRSDVVPLARSVLY